MWCKQLEFPYKTWRIIVGMHLESEKWDYFLAGLFNLLHAAVGFILQTKHNFS